MNLENLDRITGLAAAFLANGPYPSLEPLVKITLAGWRALVPS
jgi:hypothetical protein